MKLGRPLLVALLTFAGVVSAVAVAATNGTAAGTGIVQLPPEILLDRHLLRAERLLAGGDPAGALEAMNDILALREEHDLVLQDDFNFQYAQVAYAAGRTETAIASLNEYLVAAGRPGEFYREALELLDSAEGGRRRRGGAGEATPDAYGRCGRARGLPRVRAPEPRGQRASPAATGPRGYRCAAIPPDCYRRRTAASGASGFINAPSRLTGRGASRGRFASPADTKKFIADVFEPVSH